MNKRDGGKLPYKSLVINVSTFSPILHI